MKHFVWVKLDLLVKTRFRVAKLEFFRVHCESHDQPLAARGSQGHYLNSLGTDFSYHFYFLKKIIFWTPMPSKSQNYKHFTSNFNVILRFWGHGDPKNNFFQKIKTIWKIRRERIYIMSLASSSCEGLVMWLTLDAKKFEFCDSKMRFYKLNSASQTENAFSRQISKFENFFRDDFTMSKYHGKSIPRPMEHSQINPTLSINI